MQRVDLPAFYHFGAAIHRLKALRIGDRVPERGTLRSFDAAGQWLVKFLAVTQQMAFPHAKESAVSLIKLIEQFNTMVAEALDSNNLDVFFPEQYVVELKKSIREFELLFTRESKKVSVFAVAPKGLYDVEKLIDTPEVKFSKGIRAQFPEGTLADLAEAAKCLAFDLPTACAFHICRATEALMIKYYEVLAGKPWEFKRRDWNIYTDQLKSNGAPAPVTNRLREIREFERNPYIHPEATVETDDAPILFELCTGVIHFMAKDMEKRATA